MVLSRLRHLLISRAPLIRAHLLSSSSATRSLSRHPVLKDTFPDEHSSLFSGDYSGILHGPKFSPISTGCKGDFLKFSFRYFSSSGSWSPGIRNRPRTPIPFVDDLKQVHDPDEALSLFHELCQTGSKHGYPSVSSLLYKLARSRRFELINPLLHFIRARNIRCKEAVFIALMKHYAKSNLVDECVDLFHQMHTCGCDPTLQSLNTLLNVLVDCDRFSDAQDLFSRHLEFRCKPNSVSFNIMMKAWLQKGEIVKACKVFDEMLEREIQPSVVTYNSLIGFLSKNGEIEKAMGLLDDMRSRGKHPNAITYALVMKGLCDSKRYKEAQKLMFDMEYQGCRIQVVNFGVLINACWKEGMIEEAKSLLLEMKKKRLKPDAVIFNIMINYLCKQGKPEEAYKILVDMKLQRCEPNAASYRILVDGFIKVNEFERALSIFNVMLMSRHCPRSDTLSRLAVGLLVKSKKIEDGCFVLEEMEKRKMRLECSSWESLVKESCGFDIVQLFDILVSKTD